MHVYKVTARYRRTRQPRDYETAECEIGFELTLEEDENHVQAAAERVAEAKVIVLSNLGLMKSEAAAKAVETQVEEVETQVEEVEAPAGKPKAKKAAPKKAEKEPEEDDAEPIEDEKKPEPKKAAPKKAEKEPEPAEDDTEPVEDEDDEEDVDEITDHDLARAASEAAKRCGSPSGVKDLMKEFGVARLGELETNARAKFVKALKGLK